MEFKGILKRPGQVRYKIFMTLAVIDQAQIGSFQDLQLTEGTGYQKSRQQKNQVI